MTKFPSQYCIAIKDIQTSLEVDSLLEKLLSEGYRLGEDKINFDNYLQWGYIGVNEWGSILLFSDPWSYLAVGREPFANILNRKWLDKYLGLA